MSKLHLDKVGAIGAFLRQCLWRLS